MPRYIDADKLKESLKELKAEGNNQKYVQGLQDAIDGYFPQIIDDEPTADVQPVKHGRWIDNEICDSMLSACSICGYSCGAYSFNYCPNCGSKNRMDGDSK